MASIDTADSSLEIVVCASCPEIHSVAMSKICKDLGITRAFATKGDMLDMLKGGSWIPKWESKVVTAVVTKAQTLNARRAKIICISGGYHCDQEMARQPSLIRAIQQEMADSGYPSMNVKVEWLEFNHFLADYNVTKKEESIPEAKKKNFSGSSDLPSDLAGTGKKAADKGLKNDQSIVCPVCSREFTSKQSLQQHQDSTGHFKCGICNREFSSLEALDQHCQATGHRIKNSKPVSQDKNAKVPLIASAAAVIAPTSAISYSGSKTTEKLDSAKSEKCLQSEKRGQHLCPICDRDFRTEHSLEQHQESANHFEIWLCSDCGRNFSAPESLDQHCRATGHTTTSVSSKLHAPRHSSETITESTQSIANSKAKASATLSQQSRKEVRGVCRCFGAFNSKQAFAEHVGCSKICADMATFIIATAWDVIAVGRSVCDHLMLWEVGPPRFVSADATSITVEWNGYNLSSYIIEMLAVPDVVDGLNILWFVDLTKGLKFQGTSVRKKNLSSGVTYFFRVMLSLGAHSYSNFSPVSQPMRVSAI